MRLLLVALLLVPFASAAQPARITGSERIVITTAGLAAGVALAAYDGGPVLFALVPATAGLTVYVAGQMFGHRGRLVPTLVAAGVGALPGFVLIAVGDAGLAGSKGVAYQLLGIGATLLVPPVAAMIGFDRSRPVVAPVVLRGPDGAWSPGLALRAAL
jgi:hypothetical protein